MLLSFLLLHICRQRIGVYIPDIVAMEAEIWRRLPEELLYMILARLPMRVVGKMSSVCKKWNYLLSSRDALQVDVPNWSLHSTPGFLIQIHWDFQDDLEYWVIEGHGSESYKLPLTREIIVGTCKSIICIRRKGYSSALSLGIPGTRYWKQLPPPATSFYGFSGLAFDCSTRRCTVLLGSYKFYRRQQDNIRIMMCIYDSESSAWSQVSMMSPNNIVPVGNGIYCKGKFYWVCDTLNRNSRNLLGAFNITDGVWTKIPLPQGCTRNIYHEDIGEYHGQLVLVEHDGCFVRMWKLNEAQVWCNLRTFRLAKRTSFYSVIVNSSGLIMVMDREMNISMYTWKGKLITGESDCRGFASLNDQLEYLNHPSNLITNGGHNHDLYNDDALFRKV